MLTAIYLMGIATVFLSCLVAWRFNQQRQSLRGDAKSLSGALMWQLIGEAIIGLGTLIFAFAAHRGWLSGWPAEVQSAIRFMMFAATSTTTIHLYITMRRIRS